MAKAKATTKFEAIDTGHMVARLSLSVTFFMKNWRGHEPKIVEAYQRIRPILEEHVRWYRTAAMRTKSKVQRDTLDAPLVIERTPPRGFYLLRLASGTTARDVGPVTFYLYLRGEDEPDASAFHLALPLDRTKNPAEFLQLFLDLAALLPFRSGLAGYATQLDEGNFSPPANEACRRWLRQYDGIDSMHVLVVAEYLPNKVKGVNWLTAIDKSLSQKLGGLKKLRRQLPAAIQTHAVDDRIVLQAGPQPLLIDKYKDEDRSLYAAVDSAIRPVRLRGRVVLPGFENPEETAEWLARFE